jgi:Coenzyme PQQ synthesis protein D (PqqD)
MKYQRNSTVECAPMRDEMVLYDPATVRFCALNPTAAFLWERLDAPRSAGELLTDLSEAYRIDDRSRAEQELQSLLTELEALAFVVSAGDPGRQTVPSNAPAAGERIATSGPLGEYGPPLLRMMDESDVLAEFQITSAGISWWVM